MRVLLPLLSVCGVCLGLGLFAAPVARADEPALIPLPLPRPVPADVPAGDVSPAPRSPCAALSAPTLRDRLPFGPGEQLGYDIALLGVRTGRVRLRVGEASVVDGVNTFPLQAQVKTDGFLSVLGDLDGRMVSFLDARTLLPVRMANQVVSRLPFSGTVVAREDGVFAAARMSPKGPEGGEVRARYQRNGGDDPPLSRDAKLRTNSEVVDALSVVYYMRSRDLETTQSFCFDLYHRRKLWRVEGSVKGIEVAKSPWGARRSFRLEAMLTRLGAGSAAPAPRPITVWISTDADRLPVLVQTPDKVGTIEVRLLEHARGRRLVEK